MYTYSSLERSNCTTPKLWATWSDNRLLFEEVQEEGTHSPAPLKRLSKSEGALESKAI